MGNFCQCPRLQYKCPNCAGIVYAASAALPFFTPFCKISNQLIRERLIIRQLYRPFACLIRTQPVSKSFVENVRGIDSSSVINSLVEKGLLEENGRLEVPGHPVAYITTPAFLRCFGLSSLNDLPPLVREGSGTENESDSEESALL